MVMSQQGYGFNFDGGLSVQSLDDLEVSVWELLYNTKYISVDRCYEHWFRISAFEFKWDSLTARTHARPGFSELCFFCSSSQAHVFIVRHAK